MASRWASFANKGGSLISHSAGRCCAPQTWQRRRVVYPGLTSATVTTSLGRLGGSGPSLQTRWTRMASPATCVAIDTTSGDVERRKRPPPLLLLLALQPPRLCDLACRRHQRLRRSSQLASRRGQPAPPPTRRNSGSLNNTQARDSIAISDVDARSGSRGVSRSNLKRRTPQLSHRASTRNRRPLGNSQGYK